MITSIAKARKKRPARCKVFFALFNISKTSYYSFDRNQKDFDYDDYLLIKRYFDKSNHKHGIRQLRMVIERCEGTVMNEKKIARIKRKYNLETKIRRRNKYKSLSKKIYEHKTCPNILDRNFKQELPDKVYSTDITQINYGKKKAYIAAVKDLCTKEIIGKSVSNKIDLNLTNSAVDKALKRLPSIKKKGLMIHSDQGFHFTHISYREKLKSSGVTQSMSRKGNCIDNAPIESFFGHLKDLLNLSHCKNIKDVEKEVTNKINYYNHKRPQLGLNKMPPSEYRRHLGF